MNLDLQNSTWELVHETSLASSVSRPATAPKRNEATDSRGYLCRYEACRPDGFMNMNKIILAITFIIFVFRGGPRIRCMQQPSKAKDKYKNNNTIAIDIDHDGREQATPPSAERGTSSRPKHRWYTSQSPRNKRRR